MRNKIALAHIAILVANIIYGINYSVAKQVLGIHIDAFGFVLVRVIGTLILIWSLAFIYKNEKVERKDLFLLLLCGLFGVGINQLLFFWGLALTSPINSSIIMVTTPILVVVMAAFLIGEKIQFIRLSGILLGLVGAITLLLVKPGADVSGNLFGDFITFLNACSYAVYLVIVKPLMKKYHPITIMKWIFLFGLIPVLPAGLVEFTAIDWENLSASVYGAIAFVILGTTFLAYLLNTYGLIRLSPSIVSAYIYLQPVFATVIALITQTDQIDAVKIISTLIIFTGVYLVSLPVKPKKVLS